MYSQYGAGNCSICGSPGTIKVTCPCNPDAVHPNPLKHPNCIVATMQPRIKVSPPKVSNMSQLLLVM